MFHYLAHPPGTPPRRLQGRTDIEHSMSAVFDQVKASSDRTTGPYIQIQPLDRLIQTFDQFAVVSFHLGGESAISRRTLVFRKVASPGRLFTSTAHCFRLEHQTNLQSCL